MALRRWLLLALALISLAILAYGGVSFAFSTSVTEGMERSMRLPGQDAPAQGQRALVIPLGQGVEPHALDTVASGNGTMLGAPGAILLLARGPAEIPAYAENASLARALAYVAPAANGSYDPPTLRLAGVPSPGGNATALTLDVASLALGRTGFLVKADAEESVRFVEVPQVVGQVARFDPSAAYYTILGVGLAGFVLPLAVVMATHKGSGRRGLSGGSVAATVGVCPECRGPLTAGSDFCTRCGAWLKPKEGAP